MLILNGVTKRFGETTALDDVTLSLAPGELTCITGDSGSGKTTILQLLGAMEPPTQGHIFLDGSDINEDAAAYRAGHVGFIYQDYNLIAGLTVRDNAALGATLCGMEIPRGEVESDLARVGLTRPEQRAETLSGGEKQRVAAVRALLKNADVILADEPTGNLDPDNADNIFSLLRELREGRHMIVVTHDRERAARWADRVITLQKGCVIQDKRIQHTEEPTATTAPPPKKETAGKNRRPIPLLACNSLRRRLVRILLVALVLALSIATIASAWEMQTLGKQVEESVNYRYLETDLLSVKWPFTSHTVNFTQEEIAALGAAYGAQKAVGTYEESAVYTFSQGLQSVRDAAIKTILLDDFFAGRVMSNEIEGSFPQRENEVILASNIAEALGLSVGKNVILQNGCGQATTIAIVGINRTVNPEGDIYSFVHANVLRDLADATAAVDFATDSLVIGNFVNKGTVSTVTGDEEIIYGRAPTAANEVIVNVYALLAGGNPNLPSCTYEEAIAGDAPQELLDFYLGSDAPISSSKTTSRSLTTVGIYYAEEESYLEHGSDIRLTEEGRAALLVSYPDTVNLYFADTQAAQNAKDRLAKDGFSVNSMLETLQTRVENWTMLWGVGITALGVVLTVILAVLLFVFVKLLMTERRYEIAVLRSLGARRRRVAAIVLCDFLAIYLAAVVLGALFAVIYPAAFSRLFAELGYIHVRYPLLPLLAVDAAFLPFCLCFAGLSLLRILRISPATLLRQSE